MMWIVLLLSLLGGAAQAQIVELRADNLQPCTGPRGTIRGNQFVITKDPGGCSPTYHRIMKHYEARGIRPVISGYAGSAATQWTSIRGACAVQGATLGFHGLTGTLWSPEKREEYIRNHSPSLQQWLRQSGVLEQAPYQQRLLTTPELWQYVPPCGAR